MQKHLFKWFSGGSAASLALLASPLTTITSPVYASDFLEEVVVTARKREESVQDTPIAISAFTGEGLELRGVDDLSGLDNFSPNLVLRQSPNNSGVTNAAIYIRGIGQNDFTPVSDPGVGVYVDGVYLGRSVGAVLDLVDAERVEVLRGPQGTLFGRNTIGGAVSLTSKQPGEEFGGKVSVKLGTDNRRDVTASFDLPVSDTLLTRLTLASFKQDGYVERVFDGKELGDDDTRAARFSALWLASDSVKVSFAGDYSKDDENGPALVLTGMEPFNAGLLGPNGAPSQVMWQNTVVAQLATGSFTGPFADLTAGPPPALNFAACFQQANINNPNCFNQRYIQPEGGDKNFGTDPTSSELESWGVSTTVEWEVNDSLTFKSITAYRTFDGLFSNDNDGGPQRVSLLIDTYEHEQFSQEFQFLGSAFDEKLKWILGAYYFQEEGENFNPVRFANVEVQSGGLFDSDSWAIFGQGTYDVTDKLSVTLGLRYTEDTKRYKPDQFFEALPGEAQGFDVSLLLPPCPSTGMRCQVGDRVLPFVERETSAEEVTPMINIAYQWNDGLMTYVTYSEGFKGGGFTQRIFPPEASLPDFKPEFVTSYELGLKYDGWDNKLRVNGALFWTDYEDQQLGVADPSRVGPFTTNAGDAEIKGVELEVSVVPADGWFVSASVGYLDPERTKLAGGVQGLTLSSRFENISDWNANLQVIKEIDLDEMGMLSPRIEWSYRSEYGTNTNNVPYDGTTLPPALSLGIPSPAQFQDSYDVVNASLKWEAADTGLSLTLSIENVTDEEYKEFGNQQDAFGFTNEIFNRGRQYYLNATYEF